MKTSSLALCHCLVFAWYAFLIHSITHLLDPEKKTGIPGYAGPWKFLTCLHVALQAIFYGVSLLADVCVLTKKYRIAKSIFPLRDLIFASLAFPMSMFVFTIFWILFSYDRELVFPKNLDLVILPWLNHAMHSAIFPLTLLDMFITPRRYPSKAKGLTLTAATAFAYMGWMEQIRMVTGKRPYPIFEALSPFGIGVLLLGSFVFVVIFYNVGEFLCRMIWGDSIVLLDVYKKKSK
ncbi:androgen-dependent TFPI-regulating protein [Elgaria multicarinata webbii]|uniref:androgen-dependent TFPI-regulating protein n=1 Tax=Elgaria multicarinata webbii TaxID=159646 RepID=UPI002FCD295E